jgi:hypothetical protein
MVESKYCTDCEEMRPATDFNKKRASCDGLQSVCVFHMMIRQGVVTNFIPHWGVLYCPCCDKFLPLDQFAVAREHPEAVRNANKRRWHRRRATGGSFTQREWEDKCKIYDNCCAYCKDPDAKLTIHHVIPVARGGSSNIDNLVPACRSCNSHIGIRITIPDEPIAEGGLPS